MCQLGNGIEEIRLSTKPTFTLECKKELFLTSFNDNNFLFTSGGTFPEELGLFTRAVRQTMTKNGWTDGNLLIHMHYQWGLSNASNIECLANGANGM